MANKIEINLDKDEIILTKDDAQKKLNIYSDEGFYYLSELWLKVGWNQKYPYSFSWYGRPIIQAPEDIVRTQEVIYEIQPDVIIETGVAHGGSAVFYASLLKGYGGRCVVAVDIEIRPHNRSAIEEHPLSGMINLIEGSSTDKKTVDMVSKHIQPNDKVLVILDSNHSYEHVKKELSLYKNFVSVGSYIVATDGSMEILHDVPRGDDSWVSDNPSKAAREFDNQHDDFILEQPEWPFNESNLSKNITHWPDAWLRRVK